MKRLFPLFLLAGVAWAVRGEERKFFAHYMGCFPATSGWVAQSMAKSACLTNAVGWESFGGAGWLNRPLAPFGFSQSDEADAALEVRRAMRAGLDGFAVDAWAGQKGARRRFEQLLRAAEPYGGRFQVTVCLDAACHTAGYAKDVPMWQRFADTVNDVLRFRDSPAFATFEGRPLVFSYHSRFVVGRGPEAEIAAAWTKFRGAVPADVFLAGDIDYLVKWGDAAVDRSAAVRFAARHFDALGGFLGVEGGWGLDPLVAETTKACGRVWSQPMVYQYQNPRGALIASRGLDRLADNWENARRTGSRLIQFVTWNDYGEETTLAPSYQSGYTLTRLCRHWADWWRSGVEPTPEEDEVHVVFRRTVDWQRESWPYSSRVFGALPEPVLEVVTLLREPGRVQVENYGAYAAPKGLFRRQFPLKTGPVAAHVTRATAVGETTVCRVSAPEQVSDRRWREDYLNVAFGSNFDREWERDFPGAKPLRWSEMGDADGDGLPNWFEMVYFGRWPRMETATVADPCADPDGDGATNLKEYRRGTDPTKPDTPYAPGFAWSSRLPTRMSERLPWAEPEPIDGVFNPERDAKGNCVWWWLARKDGRWEPADEGDFDHRDWAAAKIRRYRAGLTFERDGRIVVRPRSQGALSVAWESPVDGTVDVAVTLADGRTFERRGVAVAKGSRILFPADFAGAPQGDCTIDDFRVVLTALPSTRVTP